MCINSNNAVINNNSYKTLRPYFALQNSHSHRNDFLEFIDSLGTRLQKGSPLLVYRVLKAGSGEGGTCLWQHLLRYGCVSLG